MVVEVGDYALAEDTMVDTETLPDISFQNPIAPLAMELRSCTCTTRKDLYYTAKEIRDGVSDEEDENDMTADSGDETEEHFDVDSEGDFDPESDEEDPQDMNMRD